MGTTPAVSGKDAARVLLRLGFHLDRIEGSHQMFIKSGHPHTVVVPVHGSRALPKGTLASIIRSAGVTRKKFFASLG